MERFEGAILDLLHCDGDRVLAGDDGRDIVEVLDVDDTQMLAADHVVDIAGTLRCHRAEQERVVLGLVEQVVDFRLDDGH